MIQPHGINRKRSNYPRYIHQGNTVITIKIVIKLEMSQVAELVTILKAEKEIKENHRDFTLKVKT